MQSVLGTSAALGFQLDLGELRDILLYPIIAVQGTPYLSFQHSRPESIAFSHSRFRYALPRSLILTLLRIFPIMIESCFLIEIVP